MSRVAMAMADLRLADWPYPGPIAVREGAELQAANLTVKCPSRYGDSQTMTTEQLNDAYAKHRQSTAPAPTAP